MTASEIKHSVREVADRIPGGAAAVRAVERTQEQPEPVRHSEGPVAAAIEEYTARIPSDVYLWAAGASILGSLALKASGSRHNALFVGQWVAPFLVLGLYNKLVKVAGTDRVRQPDNPLARR
jgi:hypothetical protein